jgi:toxin ParE1/3/4
LAEVRLSALAQTDLEDIWLYGAKTWGISQADVYLDKLAASWSALEDQPLLGADCSHLRVGYRRVFAGCHTLYYRFDGVDVELVRILNNRADPDHWL